MSTHLQSLDRLIRIRDEKRNQVAELFGRIQTIKKQMENLNNDLAKLDNQIDDLEEQQHHQISNSRQQHPQEQDLEPTSQINPDEFLTEPASLTMQASHEETLTDPLTATQMPYNDHEHNLYHRSENRNSVASVLNPLNFEQVESKPRPPQQLRVSTDKDEDKKLVSLVSPDCPYSLRQINNVLNQTFQIETFRDQQQQIIQATLSGQDTFVIMRTGGGKSLTYQLPAILERTKVTLVVSPLLSLIQDQQEQMNQFLPNSCVSFRSGMGAAEHTRVWNRVRDPQGGVVMILVTPEMVHKSGKMKSELQKLYQSNRLGRFVIDECHCACQWGHDFRKDYSKLGMLKSNFPDIPILAVTATASERVRTDCANILRLDRHYRYFRSTVNRPNLNYYIKAKGSSADVLDDMTTFIKEKHPTSPGIIYTYSINDAETVADELCERGIIAEAYHSKVNKTKKESVHRSWMRNKTQVVVATIAFGLGINKPDVRFVLHHTLAKTLEGYYQESGRAGRDGNPADCVLYYSPKDVPRMIKMVHGEAGESLLNIMVRYAQRFGPDRVCRSHIMESLGEDHDGEHSQFLKGYDTTDTVPNSLAERKDVTFHARTALQLLFLKQDENMTLHMLVTEWRKKPDGAPECVQDNPPGKELSPSDCEQVIIQLLVDGYIQVNLKHTKYDKIIYLVCSPRAQSFLISDKAQMFIRSPKRASTSRTQSGSIRGRSTTTKRKRSTSTKGKKRRASSSSSTKKRASKGKKKTTKKAASKKGHTQKQRTFPFFPNNNIPTVASRNNIELPGSAPEVIELNDSSSDESSIVIEETRPRRVSMPARLKAAPKSAIESESDDVEWTDESENEFDG